jgi:proline dehydrogenase
MLRSFLIYLSKAAWVQNIFIKWKFAWKAASRFVAGNDSDDAIRVVRELNEKGINATLDQLGEHTTTVDEARKSTNGILEVLEKININNVRANVSIKLTQIGLALSEDECANNLEAILSKAKELGNYIRIDMEDTPYTDTTIRLFGQMRKKGFDDVGIVVQSCLFRTETDTRELLDEGASFRLVKGAYKEPVDLAFSKKSDVDENYDLLVKIMLDSAIKNGSRELSENGRIPPVTAIGTHDEKRIKFAATYVETHNMSKETLEVQMLYGIRRDLQDKIAKEGYPVRIYVPFGTHWYPYFMRRLAESPANLWFFISNYFKQ